MKTRRTSKPGGRKSLRRVTIDVENVSGRRVDLAKLRRRLGAAVREQKIRCGEWRISVVNDAAMAQLHKQTMGIPTTTDVLTFDLRDESTSDCPLDLDTVICVDEARRQAAENATSTLDELTLYAVHSMLHVCGYNDLEPDDHRRMHAREDQILEAIGVGKVFAPDDNRSPRRNKR